MRVHRGRGAWRYAVARFRLGTRECDPLRDEGINFYRFLMQNGVPARCRQVMGTVHGTEIFISCCPDISRDTARDIVNLAMG
jgi:acetyl esterase